jgi:hypothetical protein
MKYYNPYLNDVLYNYKMEEIYSKVITAVMLVVMVAGVEVSISSESVFVGALTTYKVIFT